jgi:hypothetical protein
MNCCISILSLNYTSIHCASKDNNVENVVNICNVIPSTFSLHTLIVRSPVRPARSQSLYRLSYPAHWVKFKKTILRGVTGCTVRDSGLRHQVMQEKWVGGLAERRALSLLREQLEITCCIV